MKELIQKQKIFIPTCFALIMLTFYSCKEEFKDCTGDNAQSIDTYYENEFENAFCQLQNIDDSKEETHLIIKSQSDYEKYVSCTEKLPTIDFDEYLVLAGVYRHHQCALFNWQSVVLCENEIIYRVRLLEQDCQILTSITYFNVISKEFDENKIEFDVQFSKQ